MALGKPFINAIATFDATNDQIVSFAYSGENFTQRKYRLSYRDGSWLNDTEEDSTWTFDAKDYKITIPANRCSNTNGYMIQLCVGNAKNVWSEWSNSVYFWCFAESTLYISGELNTASAQPKLNLANNSYEFLGYYDKATYGDEWNSCQYILTQTNSATGLSAIVGNSGTLFKGADGVLPPFTYSNLLQTEGIVYSIRLSCTTVHGTVLTFIKPFTVSFAQAAVSAKATLINLLDENEGYTGKIQIAATISRLKADNADDLSTFKFVQDPNDVTNFYIDMSNDPRSIDFTQGNDLLGDDWNLYVHVCNFRATEYLATLSPINGLPISYGIQTTPFIKITNKINNGIIECYYDADTMRFYLDYTVHGISARFYSLEQLQLASQVIEGKVVYTDMVSILIRKYNNGFVISAHKV